MTDTRETREGGGGAETLTDPVGYIAPLEEDPRPTWDRYFMEIARLVSSRSTCLARQVGAVLVCDRRIASTGYNGSPAGLPHCIDLGCLRRGLGIPTGERMEVCRASCAEENAIVQGARLGLAVKGGWMYTTHQPCIKCARMIINVGVTRVVFSGEYPHPMGLEFLQAAGVELMRFNYESGEMEQVARVAERYLTMHAHRALEERGRRDSDGETGRGE